MSAQVRTMVLTFALALAACAAPPSREPAPDAPDAATAERLAARGRPAEAADTYQRIADRAAVAEAARLRVRAAELWLDAGEHERARTALARVAQAPLDARHAALARVLAAELALHDGVPAEALRVAPEPTDLRLPRALAARAHRVRGDAFLLLGQARAAVEAFVARAALLDDRDAIADNRRLIWNALQHVDASDDTTGDDVLDGWLALAELRRRAWQDPWLFDAALRDWRRRHPGHPAAAEFIPRIIDEQQRLAVGVRQIGVLLPLSGRFAAAGEAVRDGLLGALYRAPADARRPVVRFYDVGDDHASAPALYAQAVADGADFVVGPLQKEAVAALAAHGALTTPVLALNTLDGMRAPDGLYTFGLVPEDEALQIADRAALEGHERAIALVPDSELGARMLSAFTERFEAHGGRVLATQWYDPRQRDHSAAITRALSIDESRARLSTLRVVLQANLQAEPRRRRDAEFVFIVASPQQGRSLRPQLRFHHASDLPVYASSHVYDGVVDRAADADLDGVAFTDMPWLIEPDPAAAAVRATLLEHFRAQLERNARLFALGYDAFRLAPVLKLEPSLLAEPVPAATGSLRLDADGRIHRTLAWARFRNGVARPIEAPTPAAAGAAPTP